MNKCTSVIAQLAVNVFVRSTSVITSIDAEFQGLEPDVADLLALFPVKTMASAPDETPHKWSDLVERIGKSFWSGLVGIGDHISFLGELIAGLFRSLLHPTRLRIKDLMVIVEAAGSRALPIVGMLGF